MEALLKDFEWETMPFLNEQFKCRWIPDLQNDDVMLLIAPESLNLLLTVEFRDNKRHSDYKAIDNEVCYYASPEDMLLSNEDLFNLIFN